MRWQRSVPRATGIRWHLLYVLALALLTGCQPGEPVAGLKNHVAALAGSPAAAASVNALPALPPPPTSDALQLSIPASSLDGVDFLSLSGCAVQATINKRNSSLGRAAKASQRLLLALEFLQLAPACIQQLHTRGAQTLATSLDSAWQEHRAQLSALIFNATLGSDEYRTFWLVERAAADYPRSDPGVAAAALHAIDSKVRRWLNGDYRAQNLNFELLLGAVAGGDGGAQLEALLRQSEASDPRHYRTALAPIIALEQQLAAVLPPGYRDWQRWRNQRLARMSK